MPKVDFIGVAFLPTRLVLVGQRFHGQTSQVEPWYLVDYNVEKIDEELISTWSKVQLSDALFLPEKNEFIPDNFDLVPPPSNPMDVPVIIQVTVSLYMQSHLIYLRFICLKTSLIRHSAVNPHH